jgi:hypothetical protein
MRAILPACLVGAALMVSNAAAQQFEKPFRLEADGKPIDVDVGHAAPYLHDFDGDGVRDLLVGQFGEGRLRIYKNVGSDKAPKLGTHEWFMAGGEIAEVAAS